MTGRPADALLHTRRVLHLYCVTGDKVGKANALARVGWCQTLLGDHREAIGSCKRALCLLEELGDGYGTASVLESHGHRGLAEHTHAVAHYQQCVEEYRGLDDP
jgi:hypothetical protein